MSLFDMKILYIAPLVSGFQDILEGKQESKGLPSFIFPLKKLLEDKNQVDIVLISNFKEPIDIKVEWIKNENIIANINNDFATTKGLIRYYLKFKSLFEVWNVINNALKNGGYDFVYCHGTAAYIGNILANRYKVRCGYRIYGVVDVAHDIRKIGLLKTILKYPVYYKIFRRKKEFLLITDDGTDGDYVFKQFNSKETFPMYYLVNGVDKSFEYVRQQHLLEECNCIGEKFIFHAGRVVSLKRQDRVINVLNELHINGDKLHLLLAGHLSDQPYYEKLRHMIKTYGLDAYVHFLGAIERTSMQSLSHDAVATILLSDISNQGNVFFECAFAGATIITYPEESLKKYVKDKENGFFVEDEKQAADIVVELLNGKYTPERIQERIKESVNDKLKSWDERVQTEIDLIYGGQRRDEGKLAS